MQAEAKAFMEWKRITGEAIREREREKVLEEVEGIMRLFIKGETDKNLRHKLNLIADEIIKECKNGVE